MAALAGCAGTTSGSGGPEEAALAAAVEIRAIGCRTEASLGSGAVLAEGLVVTVAHVVAGADEIFVGPQQTPADLVALEPTLDLAVLKVATADATPYATGALAAGDEGVYVTFTDGLPEVEAFRVVRRVNLNISDIYDVGEHRRRGYELVATVDPGDSGAVLFGPDGRAGGVVFASSRRDEQRAWATDIAELDALVAAVTADAAPLAPGPCP